MRAQGLGQNAPGSYQPLRLFPDPSGSIREESMNSRVFSRVARFFSWRAHRLRSFVSPMRGERLALRRALRCRRSRGNCSAERRRDHGRGALCHRSGAARTALRRPSDCSGPRDGFVARWYRADGWIIVTDTRTPQANFDTLRSAVELYGLPASCVVAPSLLRISPVPTQAIEEAARRFAVRCFYASAC